MAQDKRRPKGRPGRGADPRRPSHAAQRPEEQPPVRPQSGLDDYTRRRRRRKKRRSGRRFEFLYQLLCLILVLGAIVAGCIVFFKANNIEVTGANRYTKQEILEASGIAQGDNLFLINKFSAIDRAVQQLPYIDRMTIRRKLPETLVITVEECTPVAAVPEENGFYLISRKGKVLELRDKRGGCPELRGVKTTHPLIQGESIVLASDDPRNDYYIPLLSALENSDLIPVLDWVDLSDETVITMRYKDRVSVRLDVGCDYPYKIQFLSHVLETLQSNEKGSVDFTGKSPRYIPEQSETPEMQS